MQPNVERELVLKCRSGQSRFYEPLVRAYEPSALRVATALLGDSDEASDAVQDAFVSAYRALDRFDPDRRFAPWFFRILRNGCRDRLRVRKPRFPLDVLEDRVAGPAGDPERIREMAAARELLWSALERIGAEHREVLVLKELEGFRYAEIAEVLEIPEGTVASRLYHARKALKSELDAMGAEWP